MRGIRTIAVVAALVVAGCSSEASDPAAPTTTTAGHDHGAEVASDPDRPTIVEFAGPERQALADQLVAAREVALAHPTVADAVADGYRFTTPYAPGLGAHYGRDADTQAPGEALDPRRPQSLLYAGTDPDDPVVGMMFVQLGGNEAPDGFAGPLDTWEPFPGQCLVPGTSDPVFPTKDSVTEAECDEAEGTFLDLTAWIQHVWVVPGWEAPGGVFAHANADIVCADGTTDSDDVTGCAEPEAPAGS